MQVLDDLRAQQDEVDGEIIAAIGKRMALRRKISALRIENDLPTVDEARMQFVLQQAANLAGKHAVPLEMAHDVFQILIDWSHRLDRQWRKEK